MKSQAFTEGGELTLKPKLWSMLRESELYDVAILAKIKRWWCAHHRAINILMIWNQKVSLCSFVVKRLKCTRGRREMCFTFFMEGCLYAVRLAKCIVCSFPNTFDIHCVLFKAARAWPPVADAALVLALHTSYFINDY